MKKKATSFRITEEAQRLLMKLAEKYGVSQTAMLELLIREKAKRDKVR